MCVLGAFPENFRARLPLETDGIIIIIIIIIVIFIVYVSLFFFGLNPDLIARQIKLKFDGIRVQVRRVVCTYECSTLEKTLARIVSI
jgi:hypothetical protein